MLLKIPIFSINKIDRFQYGRISHKALSNVNTFNWQLEQLVSSVRADAPLSSAVTEPLLPLVSLNERGFV